jgi:type IV secretory pathway component VirB8
LTLRRSLCSRCRHRHTETLLISTESNTPRQITRFSKKTLYTANFIFQFKDDVPNELIPANPLGLTVTYFREDQAFTNEVQR